jgi:hypothetical protein
MIAFGTAMTDPDAYRKYAEAGVARTAEPDSAVHPLTSIGSLGRGLNLVLDRAAEAEDLEALVLVGQEVELTDPAFCAKVREALRDPDVGAVGPLGSRGSDTIAWWEGEVSSAPIVHRYNEYGGGELAAFDWTKPAPAPAEVDTLDGFLLVLSPWVVRNVRFDESLFLGHGYDFDFCRQVRAAGKRIRTADLRVTRHRPLKLIDDLEVWVEAHIRVAEKWEADAPDPGEDRWRARARRAEAEREAARTIAYSSASKLDAHVLHLEEELAAITDTPSWRLTLPLRKLKQRRERR